MNEEWYEYRSSTGEGWYDPPVKADSPAPERTKKSRKGLIIGLITIGVLVLIAVSCIIFGPGFHEGFEKKDPDHSGFFGDDHELPEFSEDFRDFFAQFYVDSTPAEECTIPRIESFPGLEITLHRQDSESLSYQEIYNKCVPSIVGISAFVEEDNDDQYYWGSGIIISENGYIVTNSHIVEGSCRARITLWNDAEYDALLVGNDPRSDIAVLKIDAQGLVPAEFCTADHLQVGDQVVALGNPLGIEFRSSMTEGIISGIDRDVSYNDTTMTLLQISAPINGGNSGGALLNMYGQVLGITNMKMSANYVGATSIEGLGFAIPSKTVKAMADSILAQGKVVGRPALGLTLGGIPDSARKEYDLPSGLYVSAVSEASDCAAKGIQPGDIILSVNGVEYESSAELTTYLAELSVGDKLHLQVWRMQEDGTPATFSATVTLLDRNDVY